MNKEPSRTAGANATNLHGSFLKTTGIHQLSEAERETGPGVSGVPWSDVLNSKSSLKGATCRRVRGRDALVGVPVGAQRGLPVAWPTATAAGLG